MIKEIDKKLLSLKCLDLAFDDMGIYPKSVTENGVTKERNDWQNGWNAYGSELCDKWGKISSFLSCQPGFVINLLLEDKLGIFVRKDAITMYVNCNDLFYWACSDCEYVEIYEVPDLIKALDDSPKNGELLWVCRKRNMRPQKPYYKYFDEDEKKLFDEAGPERTDA